MKNITNLLKEKQNNVKDHIRNIDVGGSRDKIFDIIDSTFLDIIQNSLITKTNNIIPKQQILKISNGTNSVLNIVYGLEAISKSASNFQKQSSISDERVQKEDNMEGGLISPTIMSNTDPLNNSRLEYLSEALPKVTEKLKEFTQALSDIKIGNSSSDLDVDIGGRGTKRSRIGKFFSSIPKSVKIATGVGLVVGVGALAYSAMANKQKKDPTKPHNDGLISSITSSIGSFADSVSEGLGILPPGVGENGSTKEAMQFFMSKGWTKEQAAGIVGNLQVESGASLKTNAVGDGGKAYGIAQWHPDRQATFQQIIKKSIREASFREQMAFVNWELNNTEKKAGNRLRATSTAQEAAIVVDKFYERSSGEARGQRIANATTLIGESTRSPIVESAYSAADYITGGIGGGMISPVTATRISSKFGPRTHPVTGEKGKFHAGVDFAAPIGAQVRAADSGVIASAGVQGGYGNLITVKHPNGLETKYAHLSSIMVSVGQQVSKGQAIGSVGSTGRSTGPHLHFEVRKDGTPVNPEGFIKGASVEQNPEKTIKATEPGMEQVPKNRTKAARAINDAALQNYGGEIGNRKKPIYVLMNPHNTTNVITAGKPQKKEAVSNPNTASQYRKYLN